MCTVGCPCSFAFALLKKYSEGDLKAGATQRVAKNEERDYQPCAKIIQNICKFNDCFTELTLNTYSSVSGLREGFNSRAKGRVTKNKKNDYKLYV